MFINEINKVAESLETVLNGEELKSMLEERDKTIKALEEFSSVKLPIIGTFNAGKTTLVNSLICNDGRLPENIVPETAIPCEIFPTVNNEPSHAEILRGEHTIFNGPIDQYGSAKVTPGDFGMLFSTTPLIKQWNEKGITIVDMPGYDSGVEEHNQAIGRYISQGSAFAFLLNGTHGSLRANELSLLKEVSQYGSTIGIFITFTDLMTPDQIEEVVDYISYQTHSFLPEGTFVGKLDATNGNNTDFINFVNSLDCASVAIDKCRPIANAFINSQIAILQNLVTLVGTGKSQDDLNDKIEQLKKQIQGIESIIASGSTQADTPEKSTQDILDITRQAIKENSAMLADAMIHSGEMGSESIVETLTNIIRPALVKAFKIEQEQYIAAINDEISKQTLKILDTIQIPSDLLNDIIQSNELMIVNYIEMLADFLRNSDNPVVRVIGLVLSSFASSIPDMLRQYFGGNERVRTQLIENIQGPIATEIIQKLRRPVLEQIRIQQNNIINATREQYETSLNRMRDMLNKLYEAQNAGQNDLLTATEQYKTVLTELQNIQHGI